MKAPPTIRERAGFVAASRAARAGATAFSLQGRDRGDAGPLRVGFTASRKVGNAVARNRAKRRLRAAARTVIAPGGPEGGRPGWDYVLVGRAEATASHPWDDLLADLRRALARLHAAPPPRPSAEGRE